MTHAVIWMTVVGFKFYEVSSTGLVRSINRTLPADTLGRIATRKAKIIKPCVNAGYHRVGLSTGGKTSMFLVHRLVLTAFKGICPDGLEGCHNDSNKKNNSIDNLRWDTPKRNQADRVNAGTHSKGQNNSRAILSNANVLEVKQHLAKNTSVKKLCVKFGVSKSVISNIKTGKTWKEIYV